MRTVNTSELTGEPLNWAVGKAAGLPVQIQPAQYGISARVFVEAPSGLARYRPVIDWGQCGPIMEKHQIECEWQGSDGKAFSWTAQHQDIVEGQTAGDMRTAICRAVVAAVSGPVVDVPGELF